jgi:uncharacterized protein
MLARRLARFREQSAVLGAPGMSTVGSSPAHGFGRSTGDARDRAAFVSVATLAASGHPLPVTRVSADSRLAARVAAARARADRLAAVLGGTVEHSSGGLLVRVRRDVDLPLARARLADLPWQIDAHAPLVCLDTETTGLGTAAGTLVFLVGLGRWEGDRLVVEQLVLPDQPDEPALLAALGAAISSDACLVTYNGKGFDWPLIVTRFRLHRSDAPPHAGHLDLLPIARRLWRHRLENARLCSVERGVVGVARTDDLPGALIPARYLEYLRSGRADLLGDVVRHNRQDVVSLAMLVAHLGERLADPAARSREHPADLAALAREYVRRRRFEEGLACCTSALAAAAARAQGGTPLGRRECDRLRAEYARVLRAAGRVDEAHATWTDLANEGGPLSAIAWIQVAKHQEHVRRNLPEALRAAETAAALVERRRGLGQALPRLERDLARRLARLRRRTARQRTAARAEAPRG